MASDAPVAEVAYNCGYNTVSNFNKLFKEATGLTPGQFRKNSVAGKILVQGIEPCEPQGHLRISFSKISDILPCFP
ncbi:helix-turn-helix domain-containing protein [Puia sp. P3]|uniref:helix-turn-helix domain-containing protein n=1 Tax=Puia sp. P3 TaxID=3423952 RepID=UPI003D678F45